MHRSGSPKQIGWLTIPSFPTECDSEEGDRELEGLLSHARSVWYDLHAQERDGYRRSASSNKLTNWTLLVEYPDEGIPTIAQKPEINAARGAERQPGRASSRRIPRGPYEESVPSKVTVTIRAFKAHRGSFEGHALRPEVLDGIRHVARQPGENLLSNSRKFFGETYIRPAKPKYDSAMFFHKCRDGTFKVLEEKKEKKDADKEQGEELELHVYLSEGHKVIINSQFDSLWKLFLRQEKTNRYFAFEALRDLIRFSSKRTGLPSRKACINPAGTPDKEGVFHDYAVERGREHRARYFFRVSDDLIYECDFGRLFVTYKAWSWRPIPQISGGDSHATTAHSLRRQVIYGSDRLRTV
ncbi:hypothetical protein JCM3766R1_006506 [Sporobolomyces carnicolor]